jgi:uracil-DNA glycosylase family 4
VGGLTRRYEAGGRLDGQDAITYLWSKVDRLEGWPDGVWPTPKTHDRGTAGFPDGAGLVWPTCDPMPLLPVGGVMFVGHYTDSKKKHDERRRAGSTPPGEPPDMMPTWENLYLMVDQAGIDRQEFFFTNRYVGLSAAPNASGGRFPGSRDQSFKDWCHDFLDEQIQLMRPRVVVALGEPARKDFSWDEGLVGMTERAGVTFKGAAIYHPSAEFYLRNNVRKDTGEVGWDWQVRILKEVSAR